MKAALLVFILLCGCAVPKPPAGGPPPAPPAVARTVKLSSTPTTATVFVPFAYDAPMTDCHLESSTDLEHWQAREDFTVETNADGATIWSVTPHAADEFYRVAGERVTP